MGQFEAERPHQTRQLLQKSDIRGVTAAPGSGQASCTQFRAGSGHAVHLTLALCSLAAAGVERKLNTMSSRLQFPSRRRAACNRSASPRRISGSGSVSLQLAGLGGMSEGGGGAGTSVLGGVTLNFAPNWPRCRRARPALDSPGGGGRTVLIGAAMIVGVSLATKTCAPAVCLECGSGAGLGGAGGTNGAR